MKGNVKGITLISLIITIVIMLILAGVAINLIIGKNGVFNKSQEAVSIYNDKKEQETKDMKEEEKIYSLYIQDLDDLIAFRDSVNAGNTYADTTVYLVSDIDMQGAVDNQWTSIGNIDYNSTDPSKSKLYYFEGAFQGNSHTISNLYMDITNKVSAGLFNLCKNGSISGLTVTGTIKKEQTENYMGLNVGGIVSRATNEKISDCFSNVNMDIMNKANSQNKFEFTYLGGIVGCGNNVQIEDCANYGNISGDLCSVAGIAGYCNDDVINRCRNYGNLSENVSFDILATNTIGGIVGQNESTGIIVNCSNHANITQTAVVTTHMNGAGGLTGLNCGLIYSCYNEGKINGDTYAGGISGFNPYDRVQGTEDKLKKMGIYYSYNTGEVCGTRNWIGGIAGDSSLQIMDCYNVGKINKGTDNGYNGIVARETYRGHLYTDSGDEILDLSPLNIATVKNCYVLDSAEPTNNLVQLKDKDYNNISDISSLEIIRKDESYMKSETFVHDLNNDIWQYRFDNYPTLKGYSGDCTEFYNN